MGKVRWRLYYHVVWTTKDRAPWLEGDTKARLLGCIREKCDELHIRIRALNAVPDHVHLSCEIPPAIAVSEGIGQLKGSSSHLANEELHLDYHFAWQTGFGVTSLSRGDLPRVQAYIDNQESHHSRGRLWASLEETEEEGWGSGCDAQFSAQPRGGFARVPARRLQPRASRGRRVRG